MCDLVFLDLERTIIEDGSPSLMINEDKLKGILFSRRVVIYSFICTDCNSDGLISNRKLVEMGLDDCIEKNFH